MERNKSATKKKDRKMSFGINSSPGQNKIPAVQKAFQTTDGGAGNLGYFSQNKRKKKNGDEGESDSFVFSLNEEKEDVFEPVKKDGTIGKMIKNLLAQIDLYSEEI